MKNGKTASTTWGIMKKKKIAKVGEGDGSPTASSPQKRRPAADGDAEKATPTKRGKKAQTDSNSDDAIVGADVGVKSEPDD